MKNLNYQRVLELLNQILEYEMAGVVKYTQFSFIVTGPYRSTIVQFMQSQATESLTHAQAVGEIITGLEGVPSTEIATIEVLSKPSLKSILQASLKHEEKALELYKVLLEEVADGSIYLEEYVRGQIGQEELHVIELKKMLRDFSG